MIFAVYVPLIVAALFGFALRPSALLPSHPAVAAWTMTIVTVLTAVLSTWSLLLIAAARLDRVAYVTERLHLVGTLLRRTDHIPLAISIGAIMLLAFRAVRVVALVRLGRSARRAAAVFRSRNPGPLVVVADDQPIAFALTGRRHEPGVVVVSTAVLFDVPDDQRRVVLAHENAHLELHHHFHRTLVGFAVALEPTLKAARAASECAIERWADEHAAPTLAHRHTAAAALVTFQRIATATASDASRTNYGAMIGGLAFAQNATQNRIEALHATPPSRSFRDILPCVALTALTVTAACDATHQLLHLIRTAIH